MGVPIPIFVPVVASVDPRAVFEDGFGPGWLPFTLAPLGPRGNIEVIIPCKITSAEHAMAAESWQRFKPQIVDDSVAESPATEPEPQPARRRNGVSARSSSSNGD